MRFIKAWVCFTFLGFDLILVSTLPQDESPVLSTLDEEWTSTNLSFVELPFSGNKTLRVYNKNESEIDIHEIRSIATKVASTLTAYDTYMEDPQRIPRLELIVDPGVVEDECVPSKPYYCVYAHRSTSNFMDFPFVDTDLPLEPYRQTMRLSYIMARQWFGHNWSQDPRNYLSKVLTRFLQYAGLHHEDEVTSETVILHDVNSVMTSDVGLNVVALSETLDPTIGTPQIWTGKAVPLMRMIESILTPTTVAKGLRAYLRKIDDSGVATHFDIFTALEDARLEDERRLPEGLTVPILLRHWSDQVGLPVVSVTRVSSEKLVLSQERFNEERAPRNGSWSIPVTYIAGKGARGEAWLRPDGESKEIEVDNSTWLLINPDSTGYYRALYDNQTLLQLQNQLNTNFSIFSPLSRGRLMDDIFALTTENYLKFSTAMEFTKYLREETHLGVWLSVEDFLIFARTHPEFPEFKDAFQQTLETSLKHLEAQISSVVHQRSLGTLQIVRKKLQGLLNSFN